MTINMVDTLSALEKRIFSSPSSTPELRELSAAVRALAEDVYAIEDIVSKLKKQMTVRP